MDSNISKHITFYEATVTDKSIQLGIKNIPNAKQLLAMQNVALKTFEPLREWYGKPIKVNSLFRNDKLNTAVGGAPTSQHLKGEAIDIDAGSKAENKKLFDWLRKNVEFDQLINEYNYSWVHVSLKLNGVNRKQVLAIGK
jgi:zinc D-Ala-D-Ala carboxypeptidase